MIETYMAQIVDKPEWPTARVTLASDYDAMFQRFTKLCAALRQIKDGTLSVAGAVRVASEALAAAAEPGVKP